MIASALISIAYLTILAVAHAASGQVSVLPQQNLDALRPLLFADTSLPELAKFDSSSEPWLTFRKAFEAVKANNSKAARSELKRIITNPETRVQLLAWNALRGLGAQPEAKSAFVVRGVVAELHNEGGVGVVAAYEDGSARFFGGKSGGVLWDAQGTDVEIQRRIHDLLVAAEPIVRATQPSRAHNERPVAMNYARITVLTFGGPHLAEGYGPALDEQNQIMAPLRAATKLMRALTDKRSRTKTNE